MKSWRWGFMRWRGREGPWGSHQEEAREEKWEISVSLTLEAVVVLWGRHGGGFGCCDGWARRGRRRRGGCGGLRRRARGVAGRRREDRMVMMLAGGHLAGC